MQAHHILLTYIFPLDFLTPHIDTWGYYQHQWTFGPLSASFLLTARPSAMLSTQTTPGLNLVCMKKWSPNGCHSKVFWDIYKIKSGEKWDKAKNTFPLPLHVLSQFVLWDQWIAGKIPQGRHISTQPQAVKLLVPGSPWHHVHVSPRRRVKPNHSCWMLNHRVTIKPLSSPISFQEANRHHG